MVTRGSTVLARIAAVIGGWLGFMRGLAGRGAAPTAADTYSSNAAIYQDPSVSEGVDYARRYRRHELFDDSPEAKGAVSKTTVIAPHGGGIEFGTSELCLAVAGYHLANLEVTPAGGVTYDYWMFEGLRAANNGELHVTSTNCDDGVAASLCGGSLNSLAQHGCTTSQAGLEDDAINGDEPSNITNRTLLGMGGHLEITGPLQLAMFETNTRAERKNTTTQVFWDFVEACRNALAQIEVEQAVL